MRNPEERSRTIGDEWGKHPLPRAGSLLPAHARIPPRLYGVHPGCKVLNSPFYLADPIPDTDSHLESRTFDSISCNWLFRAEKSDRSKWGGLAMW